MIKIYFFFKFKFEVKEVYVHIIMYMWDLWGVIKYHTAHGIENTVLGSHWCLKHYFTPGTTCGYLAVRT